MRLTLASLLLAALALAGCNLFTTKKPSGCQVAGDCKAGQVCLNHQCRSADAVQCGAAAMCTEDSGCDSHACVNGCCLQACGSDGDCASPLVCSDGACRSTGCMSDSDCPSTGATHCEISSGVCFVCLNDDHCPPNGTCDNHACNFPMKTGCDLDADCTDALLPHCLTSSRTCVSCTKDADCPTNNGAMICNLNTNACEQQRTTCATDSDCNSKPATPHCRVGDGVCVQCTIGEQCPNYPADTCYALNTCGPASGCGSDADCLDGAVPFCDTSGHKCVQCVDNSACSTGYGCAPNHTCQPSTGCQTNSNCRNPTPICHAASGICLGCLKSADCGTDGTCTDNTCHYPPPTVCGRDSNCAANQVCTAAVYPHDDQQAGNLCIQKTPGATYGPGHACQDDSECKSGLCLSIGLIGYCQGGCTADSDCQDAAGNQGQGACTKINLYWHDSANTEHVTQVPSCVVPCQAEMDCYPYGTCLLSPSVNNTHWVPHCDPNVRSFTQWGGTECSSQSDCGIGTCIKRNGSSKGLCSGLCGGSQGAANCAPYVSFFNNNVVPTCPANGVMLPLPNGSTAAANVCWGPTCSSDSDCPTELGFPPPQWKCIADRMGPSGATTQKFCHPP